MRSKKASRLGRRAFLRGVAGVTIGLPFLEGLPERSAWAQDARPVFSLFITTANGVVGSKFFPSQTGALSESALASQNKATSHLSRHAEHLLMVKGVNFSMPGPTMCGHAQGLCQALTGRAAGGGGKAATSTGPSADWVIAQKVTPGTDPLALYAGNRRNGYIAERLSFRGGGAGQVRSADDNPYNLYSRLVGLTSNTGVSSPAADTTANALLESRRSVNDLVREELSDLMRRSELSSADRQRLQQHFDAIRDAEVTMETMGTVAACSAEGVDVSRLSAMKSGLAFQMNGMIEEVAKLHMSLVALAFACNFARTGTLQWGDGTDQTKYSVPSNARLGWPFHHLSHRVQSDATSGVNPTAEQAHAEIDAVRMQTFADGLDHFASRGLSDKAFVMWNNQVSDGPSHSFRGVPHIIWGDGGGYLKQGQYVDARGANNAKLLATLISAATQDTGSPTESFGDNRSGQLDVIRA